MSLSQPITWPFYEGATVSAEVPWKYSCALAGRPFVLDLETAPLQRQTIPFMREQQDTSAETGEQSLNPQGLWRRTQDDWSHGAGQAQYDRPTSDRARFRTSKGVDVWTPHQMSLLYDTVQKRASVNTNLALLPVGVYTYAADGNEVYSTTTDLAAAASRDVHDGETPQSVKSIATDGNTVYAALGSNGIHSGAAGSDFSHYSALSATLVGFVKGRLMAANGTAIYNVIASGAAPSALLTLETGFTWVGFAEGAAAIYCVDDQTEILTRRGWLKGTDLTTEDEALTLDPDTRAITWQDVLKVNQFAWDGPMSRWRSRTLDAFTTPDHRWLVEYRDRTGRSGPHGPSRFLTTEELDAGYRNRSLVVGGGEPLAFAAHPTLTDEFVELIAWVVTEGTYLKDHLGRWKYQGVTINQSQIVNPEYTERLRVLAKHFVDTGAFTSERLEKDGRIVTFRFGKGIGSVIRSMAPDRAITPEFLNVLTLSQAWLFYRTLIDADGYRRENRESFIQKDQGRLDGFQMLCAMLGLRTHASPTTNDAQQVNVLTRGRYTSNRNIQRTSEHYSGIVWCPTTPTGTWLARRNGVTFWTGNCAGYNGSLSRIYRTSIKADGTALDVPVHAGSLLPGEIVRSITGYLGTFLLVGTDKGWRMLTLNDSGDIGGMSDLIPTASAVQCFEAQDHFVWYGLTNPDSMSTGLGRADPGVFTKGVNPAYASDLMATGQGAVLSVITFNGKRVFAVSGLGFYQEAITRVAQGTLDTGLIRMGIPNEKIGMFVDVRHEPLAGTVAMYLAANRGSFDQVGIHSTAGDIGGNAMPTDQRRGEVFELRVELNRSGSDTTTGPTVSQHTFMANPAVDSGEFIVAPLTIATSYELDTGPDEPRDPADDIALIQRLRSQRTVTTWQGGSDVETVTVEDYDWRGYKLIPWNDRVVAVGTCLVKMKTIPEAA